MFDRLKIRLGSRSWFWKTRAKFGQLAFGIERTAYKGRAAADKAKADARILGSFAWVGLKGLLCVVVLLAVLISAENFVRDSRDWIAPLSESERQFNIDQFRLYAQLLTGMFSVYFATIGIILSTGYTNLRRDIIYMLTNEQVGSVYSRVLVLAAMFCLAATAMPLLGFEPGRFVYLAGTILTLLSALALFPLGQRLFNFFDLNVLVRAEILPNIARHIDGAANRRNSASLANHHSKAARRAFEQLTYIDDRIKANEETLADNLPALTGGHAALLMHYLQQKPKIQQDSYWFPRRSKHKQWFFAGDATTTLALQTRSQNMLVEETADKQWLENEIADRLAAHIELAFRVGDLDLALSLLRQFSNRAAVYAVQFQFDLGMRELRRFKDIIEQALSDEGSLGRGNTTVTKVTIADTWAALGSSLCLETLRGILRFENQLKRFFDADDWSERSLRNLPAFMQIELAPLVERIEFEKAIEGHRLSKSKYLQQLAVVKLLHHYAKVLPDVVAFHQELIPEFVATLTKLKMPEAATQVVLASLHSHWKLPRWFDDLADLFDRYHDFEHYAEPQYALPKINIAELSKQILASRDTSIATLGSGTMVGHIFEPAQSEELPDHFGQIYFELAEACISSLEENDVQKLDKVLPMFMTLAFLAADSKFVDPSLDLSDEFRLHLISTVINDLASVLGFAVLYASYFDNQKLSQSALARFDAAVAQATDKQQYLRRMVLLSNPHSFSMSASPRGLFRINWQMSFESRVRHDGFDDRMGMVRGKQHPNKLVREFLNSHSDASHLFFAKHVLQHVETAGISVDHRITGLANRLHQER